MREVQPQVIRLLTLPAPPSPQSGWPWTEETDPKIYASANHWPRVTIVTPSFQQGMFIEETIRSILLQNYPNLQLIVIDGGSHDETVSILERYSPWIDHCVSEPDQGQSDAINKGLARADGKWFNWVNSDDWLAPGALHRLVTSAGQGTACVSGTTCNFRDGSVFSRYQATIPPGGAEMLFGLRVNQPGSLLDLEAVRQAGGVNQDLHLVMDLALWLRIGLRRGREAFCRVGEDVAFYRYHSQSKTCAEEDAFALEEFALLTDLAMALGVNVPAGVEKLRSCCRAPRTEFPSAAQSIAVVDAAAAWADRMIVRDNLMFRALAKARPSGNLFAEFEVLFDEAANLLDVRQPVTLAQLRSRALVGAMQYRRRFHPRSAMRALCQEPRYRTARALLRLAVKP